ncbi:MAG: hypothetical protein U1F98_03990 [Verrucomicrobiota bacterium]
MDGLKGELAEAGEDEQGFLDEPESEHGEEGAQERDSAEPGEGGRKDAKEPETEHIGGAEDEVGLVLDVEIIQREREARAENTLPRFMTSSRVTAPPSTVIMVARPAASTVFM